MLFWISIAIVLILMIMLIDKKETFASQRDKAESIVGWFSQNPRPEYERYKRDLNKASNIVEYDDALRLQKNGGLTVDNMVATL